MKKLLVLTIFVALLTACQKGNRELGASTIVPSDSPQTTTSSSTSTPTPISTPTPNDTLAGYLYTELNNGVMFINWTENNNILNGRMQGSFTKGNSGNSQIGTQSFPFTGVKNKDNVSLNFTGGFFNQLNGQTITGTIKDDILTLYFPNNDGTLANVPFKKATVTDYNNAIHNLTAVISDNNTKVQQQKAQQKQAQAEADRIASEQNAVISANESLSNSIVNLNEIIKNGANITQGFDNVLENYGVHWNAMQDKKQKLMQAASVQPLTNEQFFKVQSIGYEVQSAQYTIQSDKYSMDSVKYSVNNYISNLNNAISAIQKRWSNLKDAVNKNSTGTPQTQFTESEISDILKQAQSELTRINSIVEAKTKQSTDYDTKAKSLLKETQDYVSSLR